MEAIKDIANVCTDFFVVNKTFNEMGILSPRVMTSDLTIKEIQVRKFSRVH